MITYELHTLKNEAISKEWALTAVFEDLELGMHDARRMDEAGRYAGIRLVEEKHNEATGKTESKTVFRGGVKFNAARERNLKGPAAPARPVERDRTHLRKAHTGRSGRATGAPAGRMSSVQILVLALIAGIAGLYAMYEFLPH